MNFKTISKNETNAVEKSPYFYFRFNEQVAQTCTAKVNGTNDFSNFPNHSYRIQYQFVNLLGDADLPRRPLADKFLHEAIVPANAYQRIPNFNFLVLSVSEIKRVYQNLM